jgi:hypothetical protein
VQDDYILYQLQFTICSDVHLGRISNNEVFCNGTSSCICVTKCHSEEEVKFAQLFQIESFTKYMIREKIIRMSWVAVN